MKFKVDSPYCWLQAISAFLFHAIFFGVSFSFGIFYVALLQEFPGREGEAAWISGINFSFLVFVSPLSLWLLDHFTTRIVCCTGILLASLGLYLSSKATAIWVLYMTFGIMNGMGANLCYMSAIWIIRKNFQKHRDSAFGLASAGSGAGGILFGVVLPIFVDSRGWRGAMEMLSYTTLAFVFVSMVMIPVHQDSETGWKPEKKKLLSWKTKLKKAEFSIPSPWRNRAFVVLSITILLCAFVSSVPYCHIVNYAIHQGVRRSEGERLPLFISIGSLIGRVAVGKVSGFRGLSRITLYQITFLMECLATTLCTLAASMGTLVTFSLVFGIFDGAFACLLALVVDDVFMDKNQAMKAVGQLLQILAFPYAFGAPFAGWLYTHTGSYHVPFLICGAILFIAACLISLVRRLLRPALDTPVLTLPDKVVVSPVDENSGDLVPVIYQNSNRLISSRACSFVDLAVEVYAENHERSSSYLTVFREPVPRDLGTRKRENSNSCSQDFLKPDDSTGIYCAENEYEYTDITNQISGRVERENKRRIKTADACISSNLNEGFSRQTDNNDVIVSISTNQNEEFSCHEDSNGHVSDTSLMDYWDNNVLQRTSSEISINDAGYFSAAAPANYVDSDTQSATSVCDVNISMGSLDSLGEIDFIEIENSGDCKGYCVNAEDFESVEKAETSFLVGWS